jgi:DNA-binding LytR/AlgR family response regulator
MAPKPPIKILIIEDDGIIAMDLRETLEEGGFEVIAVAPNFDKAIQIVNTSPPDLALVDIRLKDSVRDGIDTAKQILSIHKMPIIYLTANSDRQTFLVAKETRPAAYLLKPFRADELIFQIEMAYYNFQAPLKNGFEHYDSDQIYLPLDKGHKKVNRDDVLYLSAEGSYVYIFMVGREKPYLISTNLGNLAQYFMTTNFYRLSRSLVINLRYLDRLESNHLYMAGSNEPIRIPSSGRKELMSKLRVVRTK